ncbi:MAG: hypothetical protein L0177_13880 [Chloroflexi bacterium]|nr:hypothetical protein [Chloroflexota bacterium]
MALLCRHTARYLKRDERLIVVDLRQQAEAFKSTEVAIQLDGESREAILKR